MVRIAEAAGEGEIEAVRGLMREYGAHLAARSHIVVPAYEAEMMGLPGPYAVILLATVEGAAAGCVAMRALPLDLDPDGERACELKRLWVGGGFRGLGLGLRLIEAALAWARHAGYGAVYLDTVPAEMPEAHALYGRMGFEAVSRYNDNPVADVEFFRLKL